MLTKRLTKSTTDKKMSGVMAGVADYIGIDPTIARLAFVALALFTAVLPCLIGYLIADWLIPKDTEI
ncbi:PspC domain-containing protein [Mesobacillus harenae]|uniref:PspC domain-containing protein n=1 Tax=Mesobacillus harenae TaxID=2213203 RepID=UPI001F548DB0|nr:PspC domain-containing protein [Mesobacillus harenae]